MRSSYSSRERPVSITDWGRSRYFSTLFLASSRFDAHDDERRSARAYLAGERDGRRRTRPEDHVGICDEPG
jgi:hypothetical protein